MVRGLVFLLMMAVVLGGGELEEADKCYEIGLALAEQGHYTDAQKEFQKAIDLNPKFSDAFFQLGMMLAMQQNLKDAELKSKNLTLTNPSIPLSNPNELKMGSQTL